MDADGNFSSADESHRENLLHRSSREATVCNGGTRRALTVRQRQALAAAFRSAMLAANKKGRERP